MEFLGIVLFLILLYFLNTLQNAFNDIKIIRQELEELKSDVKDYISYTEPIIERIDTNIWDLNEVKYKREKTPDYYSDRSEWQ